MASMQTATRSRIRKMLANSSPLAETVKSNAKTSSTITGDASTKKAKTVKSTAKASSSVTSDIPKKKAKTVGAMGISVQEQATADIEDLVNKDEPAADAKPAAKWEPKLWRQQLENIRQMRAHSDAPVDTMGCSELADINADPKLRHFQVLLSLMLSSQTKDQVTSAAMDRLKAAGCSVEDMLRYTEADIEKLLIPVSFYRRKAIYIRKTAAILKERYDSDIPPTFKELCELPGVGPKMAHLVMQVAWGQVTGIAVDTHVHRVSNRLGWVPKPTTNPEITGKYLEQWMPRELWETTNKLLVGFGQQMCFGSRPKCGSCLNKEICLYGRTQK